MEENDNRDGNYLRIDEKRILSTDEYLNLYAEVSEKTEYDELVKNQNLWKPDKVYLLTVTLKNESAHESTECLILNRNYMDLPIEVQREVRRYR